MKKNRIFTCGKMCALTFVGVSALMLASCAEDGFTEETFTSSVTNSQLKNPELTFGSQVNADGSESVVVKWQTVAGAGGYEYAAYNVDDPANPVELVKGTVDGTSFTFKKAEDTNYQVYVHTLGNARLNNTEADAASPVNYSTAVPAKVIPQGSDIAEFINANLTDSQDEQAFELEAGGQYTCSALVDFKANKMTLRGNKLNRPLVVMGAQSAICTSAQLKVKYINFDCTAIDRKGGVIEMSPEPPASASAEAQAIGAGKNSGKPADVYILQDPIVIQDCAFKNVIDGLFSVGDCSWGIADVRVMNCVVQLKNDGSKNSNGSVISGYSNVFKAPSGGSFWYGGIKDITIKESTIYNIVSNSKNRLIRFNNKDLDRAFPTPDGSCTMMDNTFVRVYDKKEFGNNTPNRKEYVITFDNNIFYDCFRLQKFIQGNCTKVFHQELNTIQGIANSVDGTDKGKYATEEEIGINADETLKELDFDQPNFGINFKATGAISSTIGDPRWK